MHVVRVGLIFCCLCVTAFGCGEQKVREAAARSSGVSGEVEKALPADGGWAVLGTAKVEGGGEKSGTISTKSESPGPAPGAGIGGIGGGIGGFAGGTGGVPPGAVAEVPASRPAVAEALSGVERPALKRSPKDPVTPSGILTAGSFDDNLDPRAFRSFADRLGQLRELGDLPAKFRGERLLILVKNAAGKPVGNARVKLKAGKGEAELITRTDGRAVFVSSWDGLSPMEAISLTVTPPDGSPVTEMIPAGTPRWEVTLPTARAGLPRSLDLAIVLDTTGSMTDELRYLQAEIRGISATVQKQFPEVVQRFALVLYRDEGDEYVVRSFDFTSSLEEFHKRLAAQSANGGGDYPEAVHRGLEETAQLRWREDDCARVLFLIGDAPPHAQHMKRTLAAANVLRKKGIAIYPVACSGYDKPCEFVMRCCSLLTGGQFLFLTDDSGVGNAHAEPSIPYYQVERLERLIVRMIAGELAGQRTSALPADIIRTVGKKIN